MDKRFRCKNKKKKFFIWYKYEQIRGENFIITLLAFFFSNDALP